MAKPKAKRPLPPTLITIKLHVDGRSAGRLTAALNKAVTMLSRVLTRSARPRTSVPDS